jgi:nucleotide-binding universal stress UspA family protein
MAYANIMVHIDLGPTAADRIKLAATVATTFNAALIGVAARQTDYAIHGSGRPLEAKYIDADEERAAEELKEATALFEREAGSAVEVSVRSAIADPLRYLIRQSRAADIVVTGRHGERDGNPAEFGISTGALLMELGVPVLIVPPNTSRLALERVVIAWKDSREARRAVRDAIPLLERADKVFILSAGSGADDRSTEDVAGYLRRHQIAAAAHVIPPPVNDASEEILAFVKREDAGLIVAGAYGHSRLREWVFGGVTRDLTERTPVCCLMSH